MRVFALTLSCLMTVLFPSMGSAQVYPLRSASPQVTAAGAEWQLMSEPITVNGSAYLPTRAVRQFDGQVMTQVGVFEGVPVYADVTLEPNSILYVPIGSDRMRAYERRRDRELAGTTGSRTPSFPVEPSGASPVEERIVGAAGSLVLKAVETADTLASSTASASGPRRTRVESIPPPRGTDGVWIAFEGARWYSDGAAVPYIPDRFTRVGEYRGFPVYRHEAGHPDEIWIPVVRDGPLAPYAKR